MKIAVGRLKQIIQEELNEYGMSMKKPKNYKRDEDEESPKEELGPEAHACIAEQTDVILADLKEMLEEWEEAEYDSDEGRWQTYAKDVQGLVDQYEGEEEPEEPEEHTEEECEEVHPDQTHEEWEAEQEEKEEEKGEEESPEPKKKSKSKKKEEGEESGGPKKAGKVGNNFPYESKKLEQKVFQKLITALGGKE